MINFFGMYKTNLNNKIGPATFFARRRKQLPGLREEAVDLRDLVNFVQSQTDSFFIGSI